MKSKNLLKVLSALLCTICCTSCNKANNNKMTHRENGWYSITCDKKDSLSHEPIVTVKEFSELHLESDENGTYVITGTISKHKIQDWEKATEQLIGKHIAFVFNDSIISTPKINQKIERGTFQISVHPHKQNLDLPILYQKLRKEKIDSIDALFLNWNIDSTLTLRQQDSLKMAIDYWEAKDWIDSTKEAIGQEEKK